jgi:hypothetical protein
VVLGISAHLLNLFQDHLPKNCAEADEDKKLEGKHAVEEAMSTYLSY